MTLCAATSKATGGPCQAHAVRGATVCVKHGGAAGQVKRAAERRLRERQSRQACETLGLTVEIDPGEALVRELWETAGNVAFYRALVQELPAHPDPDLYVSDEDGGGRWERGEPGVYGRSYHVSGIPTGEAKPHVLVALYNEERKHLAAVASAALKAGVEERRVRLAEGQASLLADAIRGILSDLGVAEHPEAPRIVRRHLTLISGEMAA